jgi:glycerophosphoryl diester phosphodiesterase
MISLLITITLLNIVGSAIAQKNHKPMIIAHRGASAYAPENTLAAFKLAVKTGADAVELDVYQTKDQRLVVLHDKTLNRTTNGSGNVSDFTLDELKELDAGSWFDPKFKGEKIPALEEVIDALPDTTIIIIELKEGSHQSPGIEEDVIEIIRRNKIADRVILKSFNQEVLQRLRKSAPEIPLCYVYAFRLPFLGIVVDKGISFGSIFKINVEYLQPHRLLLSRSFVEKAHECGYKVISWGVNSPNQIMKAIDYGVDGIETDYPNRVRMLLDKNFSD